MTDLRENKILMILDTHAWISRGINEMHKLMSKVFPAITKWEDWQISFSKKCPVKLDKKDKNKYAHALDI